MRELHGDDLSKKKYKKTYTAKITKDVLDATLASFVVANDFLYS